MILWSRVEELRDEVGKDDFDEVVELFLSEVEAALARLADNSTNAAEELHFVKGSALNLGFRGLAMACATAETAPDGRLDPAELTAVYQTSKDRFLAQLHTAA